MGSKRSASLLSVAVLVITACVITLSRAPLREVFALVLVLFLPGYALVRLVFARREAGLAESLLLSAGLSLAVGALSGLVLTWTPWGVQAGSLAAVFGGLSLAALLLAWLRRERKPVTRPQGEQFRLRAMDSLLLAGVIGVLATGVLIARQPTQAQAFQGYTLLWAVPYQPGGPGFFQVGIRSQEFTPVEYHLRIEVGGRVVAAYPVFQLQPGETWEQVEIFPSAQSGDRPVEVSLYRVDDPAKVYRRVLLWIEE
ncbi:MAG TPA: DUF1616 domain-containing protein [Anaerolineales bacterium]|nr:DUF1616 domain-containing protein [Anaerolineales bacterium]